MSSYTLERLPTTQVVPTEKQLPRSDSGARKGCWTVNVNTRTNGYKFARIKFTPEMRKVSIAPKCRINDQS